MLGRFANDIRLDPANWRAGLLTIVLRVCVFLGSVVYLPSVYLSIHAGLVAIALIDTLAVLTILGLYHFDRLPFRWRATGLCFTLYVLGSGLLIGVGSISQIYLFGFSILTVILLGVRAGAISALLSSGTMLVVGFLGHAAPEMGIPGSPFGFSGWFVITLNFTLVNTALTLAIGALLSALNSALQQEIAARTPLTRERTVSFLPSTSSSKSWVSYTGIYLASYAWLCLSTGKRAEMLAPVDVSKMLRTRGFPSPTNVNRPTEYALKASLTVLHSKSCCAQRHSSAWRGWHGPPLISCLNQE